MRIMFRNAFFGMTLLFCLNAVQTIHDGKENWRWYGYPAMACLMVGLNCCDERE